MRGLLTGNLKGRIITARLKDWAKAAHFISMNIAASKKLVDVVGCNRKWLDGSPVLADPLEVLLRDISQSELRREPQGAGGHTDIEERLRELATFVHGAASRNLMLRTPH
jgi:hypothetical protein